MYTDQPSEPPAAAIVPDEVKRLRLEPGDKLIVRVSDTWHPRQIREYQDRLQHAVPDNQVLVLPGEQILTAGPGEPDTDGGYLTEGDYASEETRT